MKLVRVLGVFLSLIAVECIFHWMMYISLDQYSLWPEVDRHKELDWKVFDASEKGVSRWSSMADCTDEHADELNH